MVVAAAEWEEVEVAAAVVVDGGVAVVGEVSGMLPLVAPAVAEVMKAVAGAAAECLAARRGLR